MCTYVPQITDIKIRKKINCLGTYNLCALRRADYCIKKMFIEAFFVGLILHLLPFKPLGKRLAFKPSTLSSFGCHLTFIETLQAFKVHKNLTQTSVSCDAGGGMSGPCKKNIDWKNIRARVDETYRDPFQTGSNTSQKWISPCLELYSLCICINNIAAIHLCLSKPKTLWEWLSLFSYIAVEQKWWLDLWINIWFEMMWVKHRPGQGKSCKWSRPIDSAKTIDSIQ